MGGIKHNKRRRRFLNERTSEEETKRLAARQNELITKLGGIDVPDMGRPFVVLLSENAPPVCVLWDSLPRIFFLSGIALHPDTTAVVQSIIEKGEIPALTQIDGWINAHSLKTAPVVAGGIA